MATLERLVERGELVPLDPELNEGEQPERGFHARPGFAEWAQTTLPELARDWDGKQDPWEQVDDLLSRFVAGDALFYGPGGDLAELHPLEHDVWELRTTDIRIFGWFVLCDVFIAVAGDTAKRIKDIGLYAGYRNEVVRTRERLPLDEPKRVMGGDIGDVVQNWASAP